MQISLYLKFFSVVLAPQKFSSADVRNTRRIAKFFRWFGGVMLVISAVCLTTFIQGPRRAGEPPQNPINVSEFSKADMTGPLNEVFLSGELHLDKISHVSFPNGMIINISQSLIPLTDKDWTDGDPVRVFVNSGWINENMSEESWAIAFEREGLPAESAGVINVQKLMAEKKPYGFDGSVVDVFRDKGLSVSDDVVMLEIIEGKREKKLKQMYSGFMSLFKVLAALGASLFIIGFLAKLSLNRVD